MCNFFSSLPQCVLVRSLLLPGHGSAPGDLTKVRWDDWLETVRYGINSFKGEVSGVHLTGFSMGGALSLLWTYRAAELTVPIHSLVLFAPAIQPTGVFSRMKVLPRLAGKISEVTGIAAWPTVHADLDFAKYESLALNAQYQFYLLGQRLRQHIRAPLDIPMFVTLSRHDATINSADTIRYFLQSPNARSRMLLIAQDGIDPVVSAAAADARIRLLPARVQGARIIDFAHTSLVMSPDDPHYGPRGDYAECLSYAKSKPGTSASQKYCDCITPQMFAPSCRKKGSDTFVYGEPDRESVSANTVRRLTFFIAVMRISSTGWRSGFTSAI